jgi:hypothetical protein
MASAEALKSNGHLNNGRGDHVQPMRRTKMPKSKPNSAGPSIKNDAQYEALREKGMSKEKAARIANSDSSSKKGGKAAPYEDWTKAELYDKAKQVGIEGRSKMDKSDLIAALRDH